jgi:hypothetical protein
VRAVRVAQPMGARPLQQLRVAPAALPHSSRQGMA